MISPRGLLLSVLCLFLVVRAAFSLTCFTGEGERTHECGKNLTESSVCQFTNTYELKNGTRDEEKVTKKPTGCVNKDIGNKTETCERKSATMDDCFCTTDRCNGATSILVSSWLWVALLGYATHYCTL